METNQEMTVSITDSDSPIYVHSDSPVSFLSVSPVSIQDDSPFFAPISSVTPPIFDGHDLPPSTPSDQEFIHNIGANFEALYGYFQHGHAVEDVPCMCGSCQDDILYTIQNLYLYIIDHSRDEEPHVLTTTIFEGDISEHTYVVIMQQMIDYLRAIPTPNATTYKIIHKLNKLLNKCGVQYLENVESDHDSDFPPVSDYESDESDDSLD